MVRVRGLAPRAREKLKRKRTRAPSRKAAEISILARRRFRGICNRQQLTVGQGPVKKSHGLGADARPKRPNIIAKDIPVHWRPSPDCPKKFCSHYGRKRRESFAVQGVAAGKGARGTRGALFRYLSIHLSIYLFIRCVCARSKRQRCLALSGKVGAGALRNLLINPRRNCTKNAANRHKFDSEKMSIRYDVVTNTANLTNTSIIPRDYEITNWKSLSITY